MSVQGTQFRCIYIKVGSPSILVEPCSQELTFGKL